MCTIYFRALKPNHAMLIPPNLTNLNQATHNISRTRYMVSKITMKCSIIRKPKLYCVFVLIIFHSNPASVPSPTLGPPSLQRVPGTPFPRLQQLSRAVHHSLYLFIYSYFHIPEIFSYRKSHIKYQGIHNTSKIEQLSRPIV
jgi:hypothetical protein